jgi:phosphatidylglycerol:prolipoprotein diacylglycerol transferase
MFGPFVHDIDPIFAQLGGVYLWWYGASYTLGFLAAFFWLRANRAALAFDSGDVYKLTIYIAIGVIAGGRAVEVIFYEWAYYGEHPWHIPAIWLGGMSTHGIRLGNFIDGQIVGSVTEMSWGVKFPDLEGYRHPVVLYDGFKNLMLVPFLLLLNKFHPPRGVLVAHFILWYGLLRIFVDFFREYRSSLYGLPPGQEFNLLMTLIGIAMLIWFYRGSRPEQAADAVNRGQDGAASAANGLWLKRVVLILLLILPTIIPSDWTQDVPARYGARHPGMEHSAIYPEIQN